MVLAGSDALAYLERGAHKVLRFPAATDDHRWVGALAQLVDDGRFRSWRSGPSTASTSTRPTPTSTTPCAGAGFQPGYKGWVKRAR